MIPIYKGTADEAREKGELDLWQQSWRENMRCRKAIEASISRHFDGMHLDHDIHLPIIEKFGLERVNYVLAVTLAYKDHDGRFSLANRHWAESLGIQIDDDHIFEYVVNSHSAVLNGFIDMVREYNEQNMTGISEKSPSEDGEDVKRITTDDLRQMKGSEGLILQGCGGSLQEWVDGINQELTDEGILLDGTKFSDISAFKNRIIYNRYRSMKICAFTGSRPEKMPVLQKPESTEYQELIGRIRTQIKELTERESVTTFLSGAAKGIDLIAANIVLDLKRSLRNALSVSERHFKIQDKYR